MSEKEIVWEEIKTNYATLRRIKVPGGWLVYMADGLTFYPDAQHLWDGSGLP